MTRDRSSIFSAAPAVLIILICSALPLSWMAAVIIANPVVRSELSFSSFRLELLARTLGYNAIVALIATLMGLPAAFVLGRRRGGLARILWVLLPAAILLPSLAYAYGWSQVMRIIVDHARNHDIAFTVKPAGPIDVFRCIWSLATWLWAVPACIIGLALRRMDTAVQQQAVMDGALRRITLRQLLGPIIASMAIVTILATQEFAVYEPTGISVIATEVRMVFDTGALSSANNAITVSGFLGAGAASPDQPARAAAAVATLAPLLAITALLAWLALWSVRRAQASDALAEGDWPRVLDASPWTFVLTIALLALNIGVPVWALVSSLKTQFSLPRMWSEYRPQLQGSLFVASEAAIVALLVSFFTAARRMPGALVATLGSFLIGGQLLAIALIRIYNRHGLFWAYDSSVVTAMAYIGRFGWLGVAAGLGTWTRPWQELRDIASVDGATTIRTACSVIWPLAWPMLLAGGLLVGALSLTEVPATVLLMPQRPQVLTPTLMTWVHTLRYDPMIEASLLMMATVMIPALLAVLLLIAGSRVLRSPTRRLENRT